MEENSTASNVARAIAAFMDWRSSPETRNAAHFYLESVKGGDIRTLASTSFILVRKSWSSEIRLHAFKMLQHLVRLRWEELSSDERRNFANVALNLVSEMAIPGEEWALKSQTAALIAEIVRREGVNLWQELLPSLVSLSNTGPNQAELISMILRWLPEDITVHNEDLEGDRRRLLLRGLTESLPEIFTLFYSLLERHFGAALIDVGRQQLDTAKQHAATVTATLNAIIAYAEWSPLPDLAKYGLIHGCGILLSSPDFRLHACSFFKLVALRKRPVDASTSEFDSAMTSIFQIMMNVSKEFLQKSTSASGAFDRTELEFAEAACETMVSVGSSNLPCISGNNDILSLYLQQMLGYFQHYKFALHFHSLGFWLALMRELLSKPKATHLTSGDNSDKSNSSAGEVDKDKRGLLRYFNDEICGAVLDASFQRLIKREKISPESTLSLGTLELWSDEFEGKGEFSQYRSKMLELIRFVTLHKPFVAASRICARVDSVIKCLLLASVPSQDAPIMGSMQPALELVVSTIFDGSTDPVNGDSEIRLAVCRTFEGLLQQLLSLKWTEPTLAELLGHYIHAFGPYLKNVPDSMGGVISKLFELLTSLPTNIKEPLANRARHARLQICSSFIHIAKTTDKSLLPHMKGVADTMAYLQSEGRLLRAEHNLLGEAFLIMATSAGTQQQEEVLAWLLEPLSKQWMQIEWQTTYLSEPSGFVRFCSETSLMWSVFHTVTFFERAIKRSGMRKSNSSGQVGSLTSTSSVVPHPMASHLSWMLPPLVRLLRAVHCLWSEPVTHALPGELKAALTMSDVEQASLLGEGNPKVSKGSITFKDEPQDTSTEGYAPLNEIDIRNWLKGIRESGYNVLGLSTTIGDTFFRCIDSQTVALSLMENIQSMEFRHLKQLVHLVLIPLIKNCPLELWEEWLEKFLHPLLLHSQQALSSSWSNLLREGRVKVPDISANLCNSDLKVEVMAEKLLRGLSREICSLLSVLASPGLNVGLPSLEQIGHTSHIETSTLRDMDAFASNYLIGFLLKHRGPAVPALQISIEAFSWTDGDCVTKIAAFCESVILLAISTNNPELRGFVAKDLFYAVIQGLCLESNTFASADLVGLCREIFVYFAEKDPAPRQVLLSLPCITPQDLVAFEEALTKTASPKEQKQHMRNLLLLATGNKLKALAAQKSTNVITNVTGRARNSVPSLEASIEEGEVVGLAAIT